MLNDLAEDTATDVQRPGNAAATGKAYRYRSLRLWTVLDDMRFEIAAPKPGDLVPEFDLLTVDEGRVLSSDLQNIGPILLVFGSLTCPMTDSAVPGLLDLHRHFGTTVRFILINVREAHPGTTVPQPKTLAEKLTHARQLRDLHRLPFGVAVDDLDGTFHRAMSPKPNSAYLIAKDSRIAFRAHWANDVTALARALDAAVSGKSPYPRQSGGLLVPMLRMLPDLALVLDRAGGGAWKDMWRVMPPLAAMARIVRLLGFGRRTVCLRRNHAQRDHDT